MKFKEFLRNHPEALLIAVAIVFVVLIVGSYLWGVSYVATNVDRAFNYVPPQPNIGYDLQAAQKMNWHGLVP